MIHPTAIISADAKIGKDVKIGAYAVVEGCVSIGDGSVLHARAHVMGPAALGQRNIIWPTALIGGWPQDRKYTAEHSEVITGDDNVFREGVTIHRGTGLNTKTVIGSRCYFMVGSHVGHNCRVGNDVTLVNSAALGGHVVVGDRAMIGAYCAVHQFCRVGRLAMLTNGACFNVDLPPFFTSMSINTVTQLNAVGLRRSGMSRSSINGLRRMFQIAFREKRHQPLPSALAEMPTDVLAVPEVQEVVTFCKQTKRGVALFRPWSRWQKAGEDVESGEEVE